MTLPESLSSMSTTSYSAVGFQSYTINNNKQPITSVVDLYDGASCDPARQFLRLGGTLDTQWTNVQSQFQVASKDGVSIGLRVIPSTTLDVRFVNVFRVLCRPNVNFVESLTPFKFGFIGQSARINDIVYFASINEQAFGKNPYEGDESTIVPMEYGSTKDTTRGEFYTITNGDPGAGSYDCNSILSPRVYCWNHGGQNNLNVRTYNLLENTWGKSVPLPKKRYNGGLVSCAGKLWSFGGYSSVEYWDTLTTVQVQTILKEVWTLTPGKDTAWQTHATSNPYWNTMILNPVCWRDEAIFGLEMIGKRIVKFNIALGTWSNVGIWPETYGQSHGNTPVMTLWEESAKLVFVSARYGNIDPKKTHVFDIATETFNLLENPPDFTTNMGYKPLTGVVGTFLFVQTESAVPGSDLQDLYYVDLSLGNKGRWIKALNSYLPKAFVAVENYGFSLNGFGGYKAHGRVGTVDYTDWSSNPVGRERNGWVDNAYKEQLMNTVDRIGACPKGCFVHRIGGHRHDTCNPCPKGTFNAFPDQLGESSSCFKCNAGTVTTHPGATSCKSCVAGWSSQPGDSCCKPSVSILPEKIETAVSLGKTKIVSMYLIHGGPHKVTWKFKEALPSWIDADVAYGELNGGESLTIKLTIKYSDSSLILGKKLFRIICFTFCSIFDTYIYLYIHFWLFGIFRQRGGGLDCCDWRRRQAQRSTARVRQLHPTNAARTADHDCVGKISW
jgi:hypothetical protein